MARNLDAFALRAIAQGDTSEQVQGLLGELGAIDSGAAKSLQEKLKKIRLGPALEKMTALKGFDGTHWTNSLGMKFVPVPGTEVAFCVWETRVKDFEAFVNETGDDAIDPQFTGNWKRPQFKKNLDEIAAYRQTPDNPVCHVSWFDAKAFCKWLSERERGKGLLNASQTYGLPFDQEWNYAVGFGKQAGSYPKDRESVFGIYPWGTEWPPPKNAGNFSEGGLAMRLNEPKSKRLEWHDGWEFTAPVGTFRPNQFGIYDLAGNVYEWCEDFFGPESNMNGVWRGGCYWSYHEPAFLSTHRYGNRPDTRWNDGLGFRIVLTLEPPR